MYLELGLGLVALVAAGLAWYHRAKRRRVEDDLVAERARADGAAALAREMQDRLLVAKRALETAHEKEARDDRAEVADNPGADRAAERLRGLPGPARGGDRPGDV